jgi:hypothetical protein
MVYYSVIQRRSLPYNYRLYEPRYNNSQKNSPWKNSQVNISFSDKSILENMLG